MRTGRRWIRWLKQRRLIGRMCSLLPNSMAWRRSSLATCWRAHLLSACRLRSRARFKASAFRNRIQKQEREAEVERALKFFDERGIPVMLVKGAALERLVYQEPWYTISKDVDLVIRKRREEFSAAEFAEIKRTFKGTALEYDFYVHHDVVMNGALAVDFDEIWREAREVSAHRRPVWLMAPEDMLIAVVY